MATMETRRNALALRNNAIGRFTGFVLRALRVVETATEFDAGATFGMDFATENPSEPLAEMSAYGQFSWVAAAVNTISTDLASLPIVVEREVNGEIVQIEDHPILELLARPTDRTDGNLFERQLWVDFLLEGNSYTLEVEGPLDRVLKRLHPARTKPVAGKDGEARAYTFDTGEGEPIAYSADIVYHVRGPSWEDTAVALYGQGHIASLKRDLNADFKIQEANSKAAGGGQPVGILSPAERGGRWLPKVTEKIKSNITALWRRAHGTVLVLGGAAKFTPLAHSNRESEYLGQRQWTREAVMAVFRVTPIKFGLPDVSNFATAQMELKVYWEARMGEAALFDAVFSRLAEKLGQPGDKVKHDFSKVKALQEDMTERLARVAMHIKNGVDPNDAYAMESIPLRTPIVPATPVAPAAPREPIEEAIAAK